MRDRIEREINDLSRDVDQPPAWQARVWERVASERRATRRLYVRVVVITFVTLVAFFLLGYAR